MKFHHHVNGQPPGDYSSCLGLHLCFGWFPLSGRRGRRLTRFISVRIQRPPIMVPNDMIWLGRPNNESPFIPYEHIEQKTCSALEARWISPKRQARI